VWCILRVVTWSPVKSKIIKQRSNIYKIDSVVSTKLSSEPQERSSKVELLTIGSLFGTVLLVNMYWWEITGLLTALFLYHIGAMSTLLVIKVFLLNLSKSNSRSATDGWYCISKIFRKLRNIPNSRPLWIF